MRDRTTLLLPSLIAMLVLSALRPAPAAAGLIGYWSFDGCSTTDASGNGADVTASGSPTCVSGRFGNAWVLDGSTQYLDRAFDPIFTPGARSWSVALWEKTAIASGLAYIVSWYRCGANPGCTAGDPALYGVGLIDGHPFWDVRDDASLRLLLEDTPTNVADNQWHFLVGTLNSVTDSTKLYVDGALRGTLQGPLVTFSTGSVNIPLDFGRLFETGWGSPTSYFPGAIDEVRIFDNELDAASVAALFTSNAITAVLPGEARGLSIGGPVPNPSRGRPLAVAFTLPGAETARLALLDVTGRLVSERAVGMLGPGRHLVDLAVGRRLTPGVYLVQLTQGARSRTLHITVLE